MYNAATNRRPLKIASSTSVIMKDDHFQCKMLVEPMTTANRSWLFQCCSCVPSSTGDKKTSYRRKMKVRNRC
jgi:hypothetical protein